MSEKKSLPHEKFCHLFEHEGRQILIAKDTDDEGNPSAQIRTTTDSGHFIALNFGFGEDDWEKRDKAFNDLVADEANAAEMILNAPGVKL